MTPGTDGDRRPAVKESTKGSEAPERSLDALTWLVRTDRLTIRLPTRDDLEVTWQFRRLDDVSRWLTRAPASRDAHDPSRRGAAGDRF